MPALAIRPIGDTDVFTTWTLDGGEWSVSCFKRCRVQMKCDGTRWRTGGVVKGKLANGVGSQYSSNYIGKFLSSITTADAQTSAASSRINWSPRRFKWTRPFRRKTKSGFCACAITFQAQSTTGKELLGAHSREGSVGLRTDLNKKATPFQVIHTRSFSQYPGLCLWLSYFACYSCIWAGNSQARFWVDIILLTLSLKIRQ